jgi:hypothetical protein
MSTGCWGDEQNPLFGDTPLRKGDFDVNIIVEPGKMQPLNQDNIDNLFVRSFGVVFSIQVDIPKHRYRVRRLPNRLSFLRTYTQNFELIRSH